MVNQKTTLEKPDIDDAGKISIFVKAFYEKLLADPTLAPIFTDVAGIDIAEHFPRIEAYWAKLLLGQDNYKRHTMNIHRQLHNKQQLTAQNFHDWLGYFVTTMDELYEGPKAEKAKRVASHIATNMEEALNSPDDYSRRGMVQFKDLK